MVFSLLQHIRYATGLVFFKQKFEVVHIGEKIPTKQSKKNPSRNKQKLKISSF